MKPIEFRKLADAFYKAIPNGTTTAQMVYASICILALAYYMDKNTVSKADFKKAMNALFDEATVDPKAS